MTLGGSNSDFRARRPIVCQCGDHAFAALTKGFVALVSPEDKAVFEHHRWSADIRPGGVRARRRTRENYVPKFIDLGAEVLGIAADYSICADHVNLDPLDNRRCNVRPATNAQNQANRPVTRNKKIPLKGVELRKGGSYRATIYYRGERFRMGPFATAEEASNAYFAKARQLYGEFARAA